MFIGVAVALRQLGSLMLRSGRLDEARAHTDEGRAIMAAVVAGDPTNRWAVDDYATLVAVGEKRSACRPRPRQSAESCEDTLSRVKECEARAPNQ